jgi:hypothetical protein
MKTTLCSLRVILSLAAFLTAFLSLPGAEVITGVVESGGDGAPTAQFTGNTFTGPTIGTYTVPSFNVLVKAYADRIHAWTNASGTMPIPAYLVGHDYIMIRNDNRDNNGGLNGGSAGLYRLDVTVSADVYVYLLIDNRLNDGNNGNPPTFGATNMQWVLDEGWLATTNGFNRSANSAVPDEVGIDESADGTINNWSSIYVKRFPAGTFTLKEPNNASRNMYGVVVVPAPPSTPIATLISPATNSTPFHPAGSNLVLRLTSATPMDTNSIQLVLNGINVTGQAIISGDDTNATVTYSGLLSNTIYSGTIQATNSAGLGVYNFTFDTFVRASTLVIEAEDYNYGDGDCSQPANPLPPTQGGFYYDAPAPGTYGGLMANPEIDFHDTSTNANSVVTNAYRLCDPVGTRPSGDVLHAPFEPAGFPDHSLWQLQPGEWLNYTRTIPAGNYAVYLRVASSAAGSIRLDKVFGDVTLTINQPTSPAGTFIIPNTGGAYRSVPLTDALGSNAVVTFTSGGPETVRLSVLTANNDIRPNYFILVPVVASVPPTVASVSPAFNAIDVRPEAVITASILNGETAVDAPSIVLKLNGVDVTSAAVLSNSSEGVTVYYDPPGPLNTNATYTVYLQFSDDGVPVRSFTNTWTFTTISGAPFITKAQQGTANHWSEAIWSNPPNTTVTSPVAGNRYVAVAGGNPTRLRNPASGSGDPVLGVKTFPGDSLQLDAATEIRAKGPGNTLDFPGVSGEAGLIFNGGNIDTGDDAVFPLTGVILVRAPSTITCGDAAQIPRGWQIGAAIRGSAGLQVTKQVNSVVPAVEVTSSNNTFSGDWIVKSGLLKGTGSNSLGSGNIVIAPTNSVMVLAQVEFMYDIASPGVLTLTNGGQVILHQDVRFAEVVIEGTSLAGGTHAYADLLAAYPNNFAPGGSGSVFVTGSSEPAVTLSNVGVSGTNFLFSFVASSGVNYTVEYKDDLNQLAWVTLQNVAGAGGAVTITNVITGTTNRFFRVRTP